MISVENKFSIKKTRYSFSTVKECDFKDQCTEFIQSISLTLQTCFFLHKIIVLLTYFEPGLNLGKISVDTFVNLKLKEESPHKPRRRSRSVYQAEIKLFSSIFQVPTSRRHCSIFRVTIKAFKVAFNFSGFFV